MKKEFLKILFVVGIALLGIYWLSGVPLLFSALFFGKSTGAESPAAFTAYLIAVTVVVPFIIRMLARKYYAFDKKHPSSAMPVRTKPEPPSEEEDPKGWYSIIEDLGYSDEISYDEYAEEKCLQVVLLNHKKTVGYDAKSDALEEILVQLSNCLSEFTYSYEKEQESGDIPGVRKNDGWYYTFKGALCGENVDVEANLSHFIPDVLNPILSKKIGFQLLFAFPGGDSYEFIIVPSDRVERVKANPYFWDYALVEHWYGYTRPSESK